MWIHPSACKDKLGESVVLFPPYSYIVSVFAMGRRGHKREQPIQNTTKKEKGVGLRLLF